MHHRIMNVLAQAVWVCRGTDYYPCYRPRSASEGGCRFFHDGDRVTHSHRECERRMRLAIERLLRGQE